MTQVADPLITSAHNARVKLLRSLRLRKVRERQGSFLIEGIRAVEEALDLCVPLEALVYSPELLVSERARGLVRRVDAGRRVALSGSVFHSLSERKAPQGIAAVVRIQDRSLADIPCRQDMLVIAACQVRDPGNLGSMVRTADAVGATAVVVVEPSVDLYDPETVRATMGSLFGLPIVRLAGEAELTAWVGRVRAAGLPLRVVGSSAHGELVHFDADLRGPLVLLVGNEAAGLSPALRAGADLVVRLPMAGRATSLNVSAATAALVYEVVRQRRGGCFAGCAGSQ